ncbi:hypothetical protein ACWC5I_37555 [Kitasatospora sp. NPDC001574]
MAEESVGAARYSQIGVVDDITRAERISGQLNGRPMEPRQQFREHPIEIGPVGIGTGVRIRFTSTV